MKEGWKYRKLGEVATFSRGLTYSKKDEADYSDNIVLRSNNVDLASGKLILDELKYLKSDFIIPEDKYVKKGSLLMCMSNGSKIHLGKVALIEDEKKYAFGGFMGLVTPNESIDSKFLYYALSAQNYKDFINSLSAGANINNIKVRDLEKFVIPIPPLSEQQRIVSRLDASFAKIDALSKQAEEALEQAKALFQAKLKELMEKKEGWEEKLLGEVGTFKRGGNFSKKDFVEDGFPCIHYGQIHTKLTSVTTKHLSSVPVEIVKTDRCAKKGDLVIAITSEDDAGSCKCTAWMADYEAYVGGHTAIYSHTLDPVFMAYFFQSPSFQKQKLEYTHGFKVVEINPKDIAKIKIVFPTTEEQEQIVQTLDSLSERIQEIQQIYNNIIANCQALKQALLSETFE